MHNETDFQGASVECRETGGASVLASRLETSAFDVQCSMFDVSPSPIFDEAHASQARADLIAFTKTFFGLDSECPSQSGNLSA
jgi:hypothetical protein